jgi:hypothetical protein
LELFGARVILTRYGFEISNKPIWPHPAYISRLVGRLWHLDAAWPWRPTFYWKWFSGVMVERDGIHEFRKSR